VSNAINVLKLYWSAGCWMYDDREHGRFREPLVLGTSEAVDALRRLDGLSPTRTPFQILFSSSEFPGAHRAEWLREEAGGNWYAFEGQHEGWLCPALLDFFELAPADIWVRAARSLDEERL
jgi:hypothetical protein